MVSKKRNANVLMHTEAKMIAFDAWIFLKKFIGSHSEQRAVKYMLLAELSMKRLWMHNIKTIMPRISPIPNIIIRIT